MSAELDRWLDAATRGLPREAQSWVRDELQAHYEDALRDHAASGASDDGANRAALAALGSASAVQSALCETHLAERRYRFAAAASLIFPLTMLAHLILTSRGQPGIELIAYDLLLLAPMLYVLRALNILLVLRFDLHADRWLRLVALGLIGMTAPEVVMQGIWLALTHGTIPSLTIPGWNALNLLVLADWLGTAALGVGMIGLAAALLHRARPRLMLFPFAAVALPIGCALVLISAATLVGWQGIEEPAWLAALVFGIVLHAACAPLFLRASQPARPAFSP